MNKNVINQEIDAAYHALENVGIANDKKIDKTFRGQIATFGAAVSMGNLLAAIAFFSEKGSASVERQKLLAAIHEIVSKYGSIKDKGKDLYDYVRKAMDDGEEETCKEDIINAAIALKLAMNLYHLTE